MQPIHQLLNRIHWDKNFGQGEFSIGYYDRVEDRIIQVGLKSLYFPPGEHFIFELIDDAGEVHTIPFHRIHDVYKDGERIWHRELLHPGHHNR